MDNLKDKLKQAGLAGTFGQPLCTGVSEELGWGDSCSSCSGGCSGGCNSGCSSGCASCSGSCGTCSTCSSTNSNK